MRPRFTITNSKGNSITENFSRHLISLSMTDRSDEEADSITLVLDDIGGNLRLPTKGEKISASVSMDDGPEKTGTYIIDQVDISGPPDIITLTGKAAAFTDAAGWSAMQTRRSRSWDDITLGDLVSGIAGEHGVKAAVSPDLTGVAIPHLDQTSESNLNLLSRLARQYGAIFKPINGTLVFARGNEGLTASGKQMPVVTIQRGPGMRFSACLSKRIEVGKVEASYHDNKTAMTKKAEAVLPVEMDDATREFYEQIGGGQGGQDETQQGGEADEKTIQDQNLYPDEETATAAAQSRLDSIDRASKTVSLNLPGLWSLTAEQRVALAGFRAEMNGEWVVKVAEVTLSKGEGLRTRLELESPGATSKARAAAKTKGKASKKAGSEDSDSVVMDAATKQIYDQIK